MATASAIGPRTDEQIHRDVIEELKWDPRVSPHEIGVSVQNNIVTLTGRVDSYMKMWAAEEAAHREEEAEPGGMTVQRARPRGRVGGDADEGCLTKREHSSDTGQKHQAECRQRVDPDEVQQSDFKWTEQRRRCSKQQDGADTDQALLKRGHSSAPSSVSAFRVSDRQRRTGMRSPKTMTSLNALLQKEAKLSSKPTKTAPSAVIG